MMLAIQKEEPYISLLDKRDAGLSLQRDNPRVSSSTLRLNRTKNMIIFEGDKVYKYRSDEIIFAGVIIARGNMEMHDVKGRIDRYLKQIEHSSKVKGIRLTLFQGLPDSSLEYYIGSLDHDFSSARLERISDKTFIDEFAKCNSCFFLDEKIVIDALRSVEREILNCATLVSITATDAINNRSICSAKIAMARTAFRGLSEDLKAAFQDGNEKRFISIRQ